MNYWILISGGIGATLIMTLFIYVIALIIKKELRVVRILGTILTGQTQGGKRVSDSKEAIISGIFVHYLIGIIFSFLYNACLNHFSEANKLSITIFYGIIIGTAAVIAWFLTLKIHSNPPNVPLSAYLPNIFVGHIIFSFTLYFLIQS